METTSVNRDMKGKMRKTGTWGVANKHGSLLIPADHKENLQEFVLNYSKNTKK